MFDLLDFFEEYNLYENSKFFDFFAYDKSVYPLED